MGTSGNPPRLLLGLDVGTQSLRAALVDLKAERWPWCRAD